MATQYTDKKKVKVTSLKSGDLVIIEGRTWTVRGVSKPVHGQVILRLKDRAEGWDKVVPEKAIIYKRTTGTPKKAAKI